MRKSTISSITLATLLCLSTNNYFLVGSAYAASKSAVSPDIAVSQPSVPAPQAQPQPEIAPAPTTIEIQSERSNAAPANQPVITNVGNRESVQVNIESATPSPKAAAKRSQPIGQPVEIVLENRSTGCKFKASSLLERNADLCNPEAIVSKNNAQKYYQNGNVLYAAASGDTSVQVRRLTEKEIAAMSLPSNGDKQMLFPLIAPSVISSIFGTRVHPVTGQVRFHQGTDLAAPEGTPVVAAFSGRVEIAGWLGGYGLIVVISHGDTHETRYAHLSEVLVKPGQEIKQGNVIGLVGSTGLATGPHLHFEIWQKMQEGLVAIDPTPQLMLAMEQLQKYLAQSPKSTNKA
ncbi:peptidoglycan DD-metalloendopeptidase family protein [Pseudanabaena minima]|uniref:M23 family metallopeptidase n=1 Tax=Pseudanabaena minima TaxID=890415 RepID=UPI003DA84106